MKRPFSLFIFATLLVTKVSADTMCYCNFVYSASTGSFTTLTDPTSYGLLGVSSAGILASDGYSLYLYSNGVYSPLGINQSPGVFPDGVISSNGTIASNGKLYNSVGQQTGNYSVTLPPESSPYLYLGSSPTTVSLCDYSFRSDCRICLVPGHHDHAEPLHISWFHHYRFKYSDF